MPIRRRRTYTLWRGNLQLSEHLDPVEAVVEAWNDWYQHAVRHSQNPPGWHPHAEPITYYVKIGNEVLYEVPSADVTVFNIDAGEPGGSDAIVPIAGAQARADASAVTGGQPSTSVDVKLTGAQATGRAGAISPDTEAGTHRWNPGHGINITGQAASPDQDLYWNSVINQINNVPGYTFPFTGVTWSASLGVFDVGTTGPGQYDFTRMDEVVNLCESLGLHMNLQIAWKYFTSNSNNSGFLAPTYLQDQLYYSGVGTGGSPTWGIMLWRDGTDDVGNVIYDDVMGAFIEGITAVHNRYEDSIYMEIISHSEIVPSFGQSTPPAEYSTPKFATQWKRLGTEIAALNSKINFCQNANSLGNQLGGSDGIIENLWINRIGKGAPDARVTQGDEEVFNGTDPTSVRDYRGEIPHSVTVSTPDWNEGPGGGFSDASFVVNTVIPTAGATHVYWTTNTNRPDVSFTDIQDALAANPDTYLSDCPNRYLSCVTGI